MTDIITSRLPKTAAIIIDIIIDALNTKNKTSIQSCSLTMIGETVLCIDVVVVGVVVVVAVGDAVVVVAIA